MRRVRQGLEEAMFIVYGRIVQLYTPYVLVRCAQYTNGRRQAQQIGAYTLIGTCIVARELGHAVALGTMVEIVLGVVGPDVLAGARGEDWREGADEPLIPDPGMRKIARALNTLERSLREVLVLHHVTGMEPEDLARLLEIPAAEVIAKIGWAERLLAKRLGGMGDKGRGAAGVDVRSLLARFAAGLDAGWIAEVADCAMDYLAKRAGRAGWAGRGRRHRRRRKRTDWNRN